MRTAFLQRSTAETSLTVSLTLEGDGQCRIDMPLRFFRHMLLSLGLFGDFSLTIEASGDCDVDGHHLVEDTGLCLGSAFQQALSDKRGIVRCGFASVAMDEALAQVTIDLSGRPFCCVTASFESPVVGDFSVQWLVDFFQAFAQTIGAAIHVDCVRGRSDHHKLEAIFKAFGRSLCQACTLQNE
ncbi:MAG: imidazoleglycerol-phosphate dehydratase, partial [Chitinivibrionales bacterium]|nr:imidazoleglycerol-phosphate dehydratase [Chitinivibrionales bacterium]